MRFPIDKNNRDLLDFVKIIYYKGQQDALQQTDVPIKMITPLSDELAIEILTSIEKL